MFDCYLIDETSVRNVGPQDAPTGFAFDAKLGYYRGLGLSMVEDLEITVDGEPVPREYITFDDGEGALTLAEMETEYDRRWRFGQLAALSVAQPGGFPAGEHKLGLRQRLRISYMPFPSVTFDEKVVAAA